MARSSPKPKFLVDELTKWGEKRITDIWSNLLANHLWQRMVKNTLATTIAIIIALLPAVVNIYGRAAYLAPITTVFGHPGRRFGMMAEALVLAVGGTMLGIGWSMLGLYLSSLIYGTNPSAAYTIKGIFLAVALFFHGFLRSHTPRLFIFVLLLVIVSVVSLTSTTTAVSNTIVTALLYPILTAVGILLLVNTLVFPEFSSSFLGVTTIETLGETTSTLRDAGRYFISVTESVENPTEELVPQATRAATDGSEKPAAAAGRPHEKDGDGAESSWLQKLLHPFKRDDGDPASRIKPSVPAEPVKLKVLVDGKAKLRAKLANCKAAQTECNFELAWAVLPPRDLKPISDTQMKNLVANTIALIGACESKFFLMGDAEERNESESKVEHQLKSVADAANLESSDESSRPATGVDSHADDASEDAREAKRKFKGISRSRKRLEREKKNLELVKPKKEIESGDAELLKYLVSCITKPLADLQEKIDRSVDVVTSCLAYCYDVPKLPSGAVAPRGIELEEIDIRVDILDAAIKEFDRDSAIALENAAILHDLDHPQVDIMPRMETFLISSFLLNLRQAALHTLEMLKHSRIIVEKRQARHGNPRIYAPRINWQKWLSTGGEEDAQALPENARKDIRTGKAKQDADDDNESIASKEILVANNANTRSAPEKPSSPPTPGQRKGRKSLKRHARERQTVVQRARHRLANIIEYLADNEDVLYALKLTVAVFLVTWPAFLHNWNTWFSLNRGLWAALQLVLITEVAVGSSVLTFVIRGVGTTIGCVWGLVAWEAGRGNRVVCVVILVIGIIPSTYVQLGSKYVKAGMVSIISMSVVALATELKTVPGTVTENFLKRWIAFLIGGVVALVVQFIFFPVKARDRLVESLAASIQQISEMEACLAYGIETEANLNVQSAEVSARFDRAKGKAQGSLTAAETFLPFCANEPRLKGSFKGLALVYSEILYVLHAVVDRMDNMLHLRYEYGSGVLEELNEKVFPYRRNVAGSITLILFAVHEALTTKLPLPQFLPSARLAHLRMVNRVREVVLAGDMHHQRVNDRSEIELSMVKRVVKQKFLSWNAASAGQIEVIEYLEELIELVKLLVGANEFRSGMLTRPTFREYVDRIGRGTKDMANMEDVDNALDGADEQETKQAHEEGKDTMPELGMENNKSRLLRRRPTFGRNEEQEEVEKQRQANEDGLPRSLQRVRSRRLEEIKLEKTRSREEGRKVNDKKVNKD